MRRSAGIHGLTLGHGIREHEGCAQRGLRPGEILGPHHMTAREAAAAVVFVASNGASQSGVLAAVTKTGSATAQLFRFELMPGPQRDLENGAMAKDKEGTVSNSLTCGLPDRLSHSASSHPIRAAPLPERSQFQSPTPGEQRQVAASSFPNRHYLHFHRRLHRQEAQKYLT